jgi:uncharacterized protein (DUF4415 family)
MVWILAIGTARSGASPLAALRGESTSSLTPGVGQRYGSFLRGKPMPTKPKSITHFRLDPAEPPTLSREAHEQIEARSIDYSDIPELPDDFWTQHPPVKRENKRLVTLRLDADVLAFFRKHGRRYQTQMNAVLRAYMEAQSRVKVDQSDQ